MAAGVTSENRFRTKTGKVKDETATTRPGAGRKPRSDKGVPRPPKDEVEQVAKVKKPRASRTIKGRITRGVDKRAKPEAGISTQDPSDMVGYVPIEAAHAATSAKRLSLQQKIKNRALYNLKDGDLYLNFSADGFTSRESHAYSGTEEQIKTLKHRRPECKPLTLVKRP